MKQAPSFKFYLFLGGIFLTAFIGGFNIHTRPKVSVIMATYNRAETYLPRAIDSILSQTMGDFEFIIIDDASKDSTKEILKSYAKKDKRLRIFSNEYNKGLVYNLNLGLQKAHGEYIARMDDDDKSLPERFEKQIAFLKENPDITAVGCSFARPDNLYKKDFFPTNPEEAKIRSLFDVPIAHPCAMIRNNFLKQHNIHYVDDYALAEDMPFWRDIIWKFDGKVSNLPDVLLIKDTDAPKSYGYAWRQWESVKQFGKDSMKMILGDKIPNTTSRCVYYKYLEKLNKQKKIVDENILKTYINRSCPKNELHLKNQEFEDTFALHDNYLEKGKQKAKIIEHTDNLLEVIWEGTSKKETYIKNTDNVFEHYN